MTQPKRRGISKEILDMISKSARDIEVPNTRRPDSPRPAARDATRVTPRPLERYEHKVPRAEHRPIERIKPAQKFSDDTGSSLTHGGLTPLGREVRDSLRSRGPASAARTWGRGIGDEIRRSFKRRK